VPIELLVLPSMLWWIGSWVQRGGELGADSPGFYRIREAPRNLIRRPTLHQLDRRTDFRPDGCHGGSPQPLPRLTAIPTRGCCQSRNGAQTLDFLHEITIQKRTGFLDQSHHLRPKTCCSTMVPATHTLHGQ
jgi:hypothetical protein